MTEQEFEVKAQAIRENAASRATAVTRGDLLLMLAALGDRADAAAVLRLMKQRWGMSP